MPNNINEIEDTSKLYYEPKPEGEKRFWKQHIIKKHADRNGNGDDVFNAANIKKTEQHIGKEVPGGKSASNAANAAAAKAKKFAGGLKEDSQAASSDNPGVGGQAPGYNDSPITSQNPESGANKGGKNPVKELLETIALSSAQLHDELDDDQDLGPDVLSKLQDISDALNQIADSLSTENSSTAQNVDINPKVPPNTPSGKMQESKDDFHYQEWPGQKPKKAFNLNKYLDNNKKKLDAKSKKSKSSNMTNEELEIRLSESQDFVKALHDIRRNKAPATVVFENEESKVVTVKEALQYLNKLVNVRSASDATNIALEAYESPDSFMSIINETSFTPLRTTHLIKGKIQ